MLGVHHTDGLGQVPEDGWVAEVQSWRHVVLQDPGELATHPGKELCEGPDGLRAQSAQPSLSGRWAEPMGRGGGGALPLGGTTGKQARTGFSSGGRGVRLEEEVDRAQGGGG